MSSLKIPTLVGAFALLAALSGQLLAQDTLSNDYQFTRRHQAGIRIGGWANLGESPRSIIENPNTYVETDFNGGSFYIEGYYAHRFSRMLMGEITLGVVNRGDVTIADGTDVFYGSLLIYPMTIRAKIYPIAGGLGSVFPYFTAGGGFYYAKHNIQFYESSYYYSYVNTSSETKFNYVLGGGVDIPLASMIGLEVAGQYLPVNFSDPIIDIKDYSALTITVGVKYLFSSFKKSDDRSRRGR